MAEGSENIDAARKVAEHDVDWKTWQIVNKFIVLLNNEKPTQDQGLDACCLLMATMAVAYGVDETSVLQNFRSGIEAIQDLRSKGHRVAEIYNPDDPEHKRAERIAYREMTGFNQPDVLILDAIRKAFRLGR